MNRVLIFVLMTAVGYAQGRTAVSVTTATKTGFPTAFVDFNIQQADATNGNSVTMSGDFAELVWIQNTAATTVTVSLTTVADSRSGRTGDIQETLQPGESKIVGPFRLDGFRQTGGDLHFASTTDNVSFAVIRLPR